MEHREREDVRESKTMTGIVKRLAEALQEALAEDMTPARIAEARRLTEAWIETHSAAE